MYVCKCLTLLATLLMGIRTCWRSTSQIKTDPMYQKLQHIHNSLNSNVASLEKLFFLSSQCELTDLYDIRRGRSLERTLNGTTRRRRFVHTVYIHGAVFLCFSEKPTSCFGNAMPKCHANEARTSDPKLEGEEMAKL